ncbi:MAG: TonB-dependent receptor [Bacteroidia bacterium]|nr:TonB-dependent receptor [Bacteroidia bacterium]
MRLLIITTFSLILSSSLAQEQADQDTVRRLDEVVVKAYAYDRGILEVPAAIAVLDSIDLNRFNNTSFLPAINTVPGVRMEERSPGSYRLSVRGSTLRSPFGVRNVKVYWNGLPLTDGGGNTYLNSLDFNSINNIEIVKGPGASLYGAGTGGVVLLSSQLKRETTLSGGFMGGSYGLTRFDASGTAVAKKGTIKFGIAQQNSSGYREQTAMTRLAAQIDGIVSIGKRSTLSTIMLASNLDYETPGGLTKAQYEANPRQARPGTATQPGAVDQKAAVSNNTVYLGFVHEINWNEAWLTRTGIYGSNTDFKNPSIRNYEARTENNGGGRTETQYKFRKPNWQGKFTFGGEFQYFYSPVEVYGNDKGLPTSTIQLIDTLTSRSFLGFAQVEFDLPRQYFLTVGTSSNFLKYHFDRSVPTIVIQDRKFNAEFSPRIALLKKLNSSLSIYSSLSYGFSPPTFAEVRPSTGNFNNDLNPEHGTSYEVGVRGNALKRLTFDLTAYNFQLSETIVIQRTPDGAEYFINAGKTSQKGFEAKVSWLPNVNSNVLSSFRLWSSYSLYNYHFVDYVNDAKDYSGNLLTGVSPNVALAGIDLTVWKKVYTNVTFTYVDHTPMNDANSEFAAEYFLIGTRVGYKTVIGRKVPLEIFGGVDNLLDEIYSLGNDVNAIGGRYYNAAARRNYYFGIKLSLF